MAHTNETSNYELTQFVGSDKPAWLVDYNGDMLKIDTDMKAISDVADAAKSKADTNETNIATVTTTANSASAKASGAISDLSDEYDPTSTYAVGDLVIYNNLLYKCTTAITVPEAFDGTHWTRTTIEELIDTINSKLTENSITGLSVSSGMAVIARAFYKINHLVILNARIEFTTVDDHTISGLPVPKTLSNNYIPVSSSRPSMVDSFYLDTTGVMHLINLSTSGVIFINCVYLTD